MSKHPIKKEFFPLHHIKFPLNRRMIGPVPCLMLDHGGGFVLEVAPYHHRLAPEHPFPTQFEDCFAGLSRALERAKELGSDRERSASAAAARAMVDRRVDFMRRKFE